MENGGNKTPDGQLDLLPREGIDWSRVEPIRRVWLEDMGGDHGARLEFLADQGLRLIMADPGPAGGETLHFHNPRDRETLHLRAGGGKSLLSESDKYFPAASRWIELLHGGGEWDMDMRETASMLARCGSLLEVEGGRIRRVFEASRDYPQVVLCDAKAGQAGALLENEYGTDGTALTLAFVQALEDARGMKVPVAALAMRAVILESSRVQVHLAWLGAVASNLGRRRIGARCAGVRRDLAAVVEEWLEDPLGKGWVIPGGLREDFPLEGTGDYAAKLAAITGIWRELSPRVMSLPIPRWIERKLGGLRGEAESGGWVGPLARTAGSGVDVRREEPAVYEAAGWESDDAAADAGMLRRMLAIRATDVTSSLGLMERILGDPPDTPLLVKRGRGGRGEGFGRCEGPEGETCCHVALEKGRIDYMSFSLPRELNRSASRILAGCRLDEMEMLSMLWEDQPTRISS
jgi:Ni,Fe-hydrogenase III large subunit